MTLLDEPLEALEERRIKLLGEVSKIQKAMRQRKREHQVAAPALLQKHVENGRLVATRLDILKQLPCQPVVAELGVAAGVFSKSILSILKPDKLHLFDLRFTRLDIEFYKPLVESGRVELHSGDSSTNLNKFPDEHFDFIYIDGDHGLEGVMKDTAAAKRKVKRDGIIGFNDYTTWGVNEMIPYGVMNAVNKLCIEDDWGIAYMSVAYNGHYDVFVRRL